MLKKLAKIAAFSPYHCHRIFRSIVGESVQNYIRRLRLEAAETKLLQSDVAVTEIAREAGYDNLESFIRAFRERFGTAPIREIVALSLPIWAPSSACVRGFNSCFSLPFLSSLQ